MSVPIEDYAVLGDTRTAALVGKNGSVDWLCLPRFDSGACFAALLGDARHGRWSIAPIGATRTTRRYRDGTLILETEHTTCTGVVRVTDCMPPRVGSPNLLRLVEGVSGQVAMRMDLVIRFDYGWVIPWVRTIEGVLTAIGGPDALELRTPVPVHGEGLTSVAEFSVAAGEQVPFALSWHPSNEVGGGEIDVVAAISAADAWWREWSARCTYHGPWRDAVVSSLITLKALTYLPTGGIVAAATTSLPESLGGVRNWDYRYCWLRDATYTLYALMLAGYADEANQWRDWLLRAVAGSPQQLQIMYGVAGERRLPETNLDWLPGYAGARPVRIGNGAAHQLQLDVYGEVSDALYQARKIGLLADENAWSVQRRMLEYLETAWPEPDEGIWETRGPRQHFTHSKMMTWVAFDRAVKTLEWFQMEGPIERWRRIRDEIHADVCARGYDRTRNTFTQSYGSTALDASLLLMPLVGFLPASDERMLGTVRAIEHDLLQEGLVLRYRTEQTNDGLPAGEGVFIAGSFWLADNYALGGRMDDARALFERLLGVRNDVGLLAEEYDPRTGRLLGNFPQAFSHVGLVNTAFNLTRQRVTPVTRMRHG
ncbi:MAG: glycoside hydrolase family 15 protein [Kofleriaceae bacterium]